MMKFDPFCNKDILNNTFYLTESTMAVYDIKPVLPGHSLLIPRRHVADITALEKNEVVDIFNTLNTIKPVIFKLYNADSYDFTAQVGEYSGMTVPHLHFHFIPRNEKDKFQTDNNSVYEGIEHSKQISPTEMSRNVELLRKELNWSH